MATILEVSLFILIVSIALFVLSFILTLAFDDYFIGNVFDVLMYVFAVTTIVAVVFMLIIVIAFYSEVSE